MRSDQWSCREFREQHQKTVLIDRIHPLYRSAAAEVQQALIPFGSTSGPNMKRASTSAAHLFNGVNAGHGESTLDQQLSRPDFARAGFGSAGTSRMAIATSARPSVRPASAKSSSNGWLCVAPSLSVRKPSGPAVEAGGRGHMYGSEDSGASGGLFNGRLGRTADASMLMHPSIRLCTSTAFLCFPGVIAFLGAGTASKPGLRLTDRARIRKFRSARVWNCWSRFLEQPRDCGSEEESMKIVAFAIRKDWLCLFFRLFRFLVSDDQGICRWHRHSRLPPASGRVCRSFPGRCFLRTASVEKANRVPSD